MLRVGFGCGDLYAGVAHAASARLVETALDSGIRYFDVARLYGNGSAETVLGSILPRVRDQVIIASKAGILPYSMLRWTQFTRTAAKAARIAGPLARALVPEPPPSAARFGAFSLSELARSVARSLQVLRTDYLDILLLHECSVADARRHEVLDFLERLRSQGKIRRFGIATHYPETIEIMNDVPRIAPIVQFPSDALNRNVSRLPVVRLDLVVTHSSVKYILPRLVDHLTADPASARRWAERTGIAADDRSKIAGLLLADAVAENASGVVLFSSSRPERVAAAATTSSLDGARSAALREELARMPGAGVSAR